MGSETYTARIGNADVIAELEYWLAEARKGEISYLALGVVKERDQVAASWAGATGMEEWCIRPLRTVIQELELIELARRLGPRNLNLDASYHEWSFGNTPVNWDFLPWLVDAEMTRRRLKAPPPLRIHFSNEEKLDNRGLNYFETVFRPLLPLIGAIEDVDACGGRHKPVYVPNEIVVAAKSGVEVPLFHATDKDRYTMALWLHGTRPVTITLREASHWTHRNSNIEAWLKFAAELMAKGEEVIFIRDTYKAIEPLPGFCSCPSAAWNPGLRLALYEQAKCNLVTSNGPSGLCLWSQAPYLYFANLKPDVRAYAANSPAWWLKSNGLVPGEQWPWALPTQRMVWKTDDYSNLCEAWERYGYEVSSTTGTPGAVLDAQQNQRYELAAGGGLR